MSRLLPRAKTRLRDATKPIAEAAVGALTIGMLRTTRYFDPIKTANLFGRIARSVGPMMREQRIGRANLTAAFPEKSPAEIETILAGVWDNLGRVGAEFAHLDHIWEHDPAYPEQSRIEILPMASRSPSSAARPAPIRCWRGYCGKSNARYMACGSSACPVTVFAPNYPTKYSRSATPPAKSIFRARHRRLPRWSRAGSANIPINGYGCIAAGGS